ncbi:hypothetical protein Hanom_Chr05g00391391 [Helianthus anomalus]
MFLTFHSCQVVTIMIARSIFFWNVETSLLFTSSSRSSKEVNEANMPLHNHKKSAHGLKFQYHSWAHN